MVRADAMRTEDKGNDENFMVNVVFVVGVLGAGS